MAPFKPIRSLPRVYSVNSYYCQRQYSGSNNTWQKWKKLLRPELPMLKQLPKIDIKQSCVPFSSDIAIVNNVEDALERAKLHSNKTLEELIKQNNDKSVPYQKADK